jgi:hypothetical protein
LYGCESRLPIQEVVSLSATLFATTFMKIGKQTCRLEIGMSVALSVKRFFAWILRER